MYIVAYCPPRPPDPKNRIPSFRLVGVADSVENVVSILRRHNSKGSINNKIGKTLAAEGMAVKNRFVVISLTSDRIRKIADGLSARSSMQVSYSGITDDMVRDIFFNGLAIHRNQKINDILR
jgi:hypothetical protein